MGCSANVYRQWQHSVLGRAGEALLITAEGQVFRGQLGKGIVLEGKQWKVVWDQLKEVKPIQ